MGLIYSIKEAFAGMRRAKLSTLIAITTVAFLLLILGVFGLLSFNVHRLVDILNARVDMQVFISDALNEQEISALGARILNIEGVENVEFISKEAAAAEFEKEFGQEIFDTLEENPLPASFLVQLSPDQQTVEALKRVARQIEAERGVDEVVYHGEALRLLTRFTHLASYVSAALILFVSLGSLFVISNTIRLIIIARRHIIDTMKLVGATRGFIRRPFLIEGIFQGTMGGLLAFLIIYVSYKVASSLWPNILYVPSSFFVGLIAVGLFFGLVGSLLAIKKFL